MKDEEQKNPNMMNRNVNAQDTHVLYTDDIFMTISELGIVLDFGQRVANTNQIQIVSRVGMSREHAKKFLQELGKLVAMTEGESQTGMKKN